MEQLNLFGKKVNGKLELSNKSAYNQWFESLPEGADIVIKFRNQKDYKSTRQLRLCYLCYRAIMAHTGHSLGDVKLMMKMEQGLCWTHNINGTDITECKSVGDMTKEELSNFILQMDIWSIQTLNLPLLKDDDIQFLKT